MAEHKKSPNKAQQRVDEIYAELLDRIRLLRYPPGMRLSEVQLAKEFGVSRTPIRRVLQRLEFEELAERSQGSFTAVTSYTLEFVLDVYQLRTVLAENLDRLSSKPLDAEGIASLEDLRRRIKRLADKPDLEALGRIHYEYQDKLAECIGNQCARQLTIRTYNQIARFWLQEAPRLNWREEIKILVEEISGVIDAMKAGDIRSVGYLRRNHIALVLHRLQRLQIPGEQES